MPNILKALFNRPVLRENVLSIENAWIERASGSLNCKANLLFTLDAKTTHSDPLSLLQVFPAAPHIELRVGLIASAAPESTLAAWAAAHQGPFFRRACDQAGRAFSEGVRTLRHYLWLVVEAAGSDSEVTALLDALNTECRDIAKHAGFCVSALSVTSPEAHSVLATYGTTPASAVDRSFSGFLVPAHEEALTARPAHNFVDVLLTAVPTEAQCTVWTSWTQQSELAPPRAIKFLFPLGKKQYLASTKLSDLKKALANGESVGALSCSVTLHGRVPSPARLVATTARRCGFRVYDHASAGRTPVAFFATELEADALVPVVTRGLPSAGTSSGVLLQSPANEALSFDPFDAIGSHNVAISGSAGTGKDFLAWRILETHLANGHPGWVMGFDAAMPDFLKDAAGTCHTVTRNSTGLNPFAMCQHAEHAYELKSWLAALCLHQLQGSPLASPWFEDKLNAVLECALADGWARFGADLTLTNLQALLQDGDDLQQELAGALTPYTDGGAYGALFAGDPLDLHADGLCVVNTQEFWGDRLHTMVELTLLSMLDLHWDSRPDRIKKMALLSELGALEVTPQHLPSAGAVLRRVLRRARRHRGAYISTMQPGMLPLHDVPNADIGKAAIEMAGWLVMCATPWHLRDRIMAEKMVPATMADAWERVGVSRATATFILGDAQNRWGLYALKPGRMQLQR